MIRSVVAVALPTAVVAIGQITVARVGGLAYSGELSVYAGLSSIMAIALGTRWDSQVLVSKPSESAEAVKNGLFGLAFYSFWALIFAVVMRAPTELYFKIDSLIVVAAGTSIALVELACADLFKKTYFFRYAALRMTSILIVVGGILLQESDANVNYAASQLWLIGCVFATGLATWYLWGAVKVQLVAASENFALFFGAKIVDQKAMVLPTFAALLAALLGNVWVILVYFQFTPEAAGVWSTVYRIYSAPLFFITAVLTPAVYAATSRSIEQYGPHGAQPSFTPAFRFSGFILLVGVGIGALGYLDGGYIFKVLIGTSSQLRQELVLTILMIAAVRCTTGVLQGTYQAVGQSRIVVGGFLVEIFVGVLFYYLLDCNELTCFARIGVYQSVCGLTYFGMHLFLMGNGLGRRS